MIESELISEIIDVTIEGEKYESQLNEQLNYLNEKEYEHTGTGLYVYFENEPDISKHRLSDEQLNEMFNGYNHELTKFELLNEKLQIQADVTVHFSNGIIDCVEIWNKLGDYPEEDLLTWQLKRIVG